MQDRNEKGMTFALAMYTRKRSRGWRTLAKKLFSGSLRALSLSRLEFNSDLFLNSVYLPLKLKEIYIKNKEVAWSFY